MGNHTVENIGNTTIGNINPIRYRGYYYDVETNLYYLKARYYDPQTHRFISMDDVSYANPEIINGLNLFAYCNNDPISNVDPEGTFLISLLAGLLIFSASIGLGLTIGGRITNNKTITNIGDCILSGVEIIGGFISIATGFLPNLGVKVFNTGIGSLTNGLINMSNGGSFHAGWAGGQIGTVVSSFVPIIGKAVGSFASSTLTDLIDSKYSFESIDFGKATASAVIASILPSFCNLASKFNGLPKIGYFIFSFLDGNIGVANSIINIYWRGRRNENKVIL